MVVSENTGSNRRTRSPKGSGWASRRQMQTSSPSNCGLQKMLNMDGSPNLWHHFGEGPIIRTVAFGVYIWIPLFMETTI